MSGDDAPAPAPQAAPKRAGRMTAALSFGGDEMDLVTAVGLLKQEAYNIRRTGVAAAVANVEGVLRPMLTPYMSATASTGHKDDTGDEHHDLNMETLSSAPATFKEMAAATGTQSLQLDKEHALNVYCCLVEKLKEGHTAADGNPTLYLDDAGGQKAASKKGGFSNGLYPHINVPRMQQSTDEQNRCLFAMKSSKFATLTGQAGNKLQTQAAKAVTKAFSKNASIVAVHVLFHWNKHSFFTYHQDTDGDVTVIVNLMHGEAEMHVAGKDVAKYDGVGSAHLFPAKLFHRSGAAPRRCVKVAFFFKLTDPADAEDLEAESEEVAGPSTQSEVKAEVKDEVKPKVEAEDGEAEEPATSAPGTGEEGADELLEPIVKAEKKEEAAPPSAAAKPPKETPNKKKRARA